MGADDAVWGRLRTGVSGAGPPVRAVPARGLARGVSRRLGGTRGIPRPRAGAGGSAARGGRARPCADPSRGQAGGTPRHAPGLRLLALREVSDVPAVARGNGRPGARPADGLGAAFDLEPT